MKFKYRVDIVLATYNGSNYLEEQLVSIFNQTYTNWKLIISDDASTDNTLELASKVIEKYGLQHKVEYHKRSIGTPGPMSNFISGLQHSTARFVMFCDQDDVWLENKIECQLADILKIDQSLPCVSFCDSTVVDTELNVIDQSFRNYESINIPSSISFKDIAFQNFAPGCCMIMNYKLRDLVLSLDIALDDIVMHDWLIMQIASLKGKISISNKQLMLYRQHGRNQVGVTKKLTIETLVQRFKASLINHKNTKKQILAIRRALYCSDDAFLEISVVLGKGKMAKLWCLYKNKIIKSGWKRTLCLYLMI